MKMIYRTGHPLAEEAFPFACERGAGMRRNGEYRTMRDVMIIGGLPAVISLTENGRLYRGLFVGLSGQVDFYAVQTSDLQARGEAALREFLGACRVRRRHPLQLRNGPRSGYVLEDVYAQLDGLAQQRGISLNKFVQAQLAEFMAVVEEHPAEDRLSLRDDMDQHYFC
ncbi:hypothetical protein OQ252_10750 [Acetobacter farinalis]|uniref:Toxin-antitoxin system HicB family antitoxin n=1 Tax=Acetobacter farinalis TaxID=1260984 RepID=A0ABT3Q9E9_9PROT|nr:hypothetical protein [Acetobacter farinalis]MCX2561871.1 hypothetical protein [Acetobacter farinalis]